VPDKDSNLFDQLRSKQLVGVSRDNFSSATDQTFIEECNLDEFKLINVIGQATNMQSQSGPIESTQIIVQETYTSTGDDADFFKPTVGVWQLIGGDTVSSGGTGSINWSLKDEDGTLALIFQTSVNGQEPISDNDRMQTGGPIFVSPENWLFANITTVATSIRPSISFIRVR